MKASNTAYPSLLFTIITLLLTSCSETSVNTADNFKVVELPDKSVVYLNHHSSIQYDKDFNNREITLNGEAFFIVEEGGNPFIISTLLGEIIVKGTELNVKINKVEEELDVDVNEGEVEVKAGNEKASISKGERITYSKKDNKLNKGKSKGEFRGWLKHLNAELKLLDKEISKGSKVLKKETKKVGKKLDKLIK